MSKLVIVESPNKAKKIQKYLGKGWEVLASRGHVRDLPPKALGVDIANDFTPTYEVARGKGKVLSYIRQVAKRSTAIYLATDPDREGEAIAWHVLEAIGTAARGKALYRVTFSEITSKAIRAAFAKPRQLDMNLVNSQQARRVLDRLVGWKVSPVLGRAFGVSLSAGRVQSVAVRLVVERELEIENFKTEQYWDLRAQFARYEPPYEEFSARLAVLFSPSDKELEAKRLPTERVHAIAQELNQPHVHWRVLDIEMTERLRRPPPPFITSTLQQKGSSVLKLSPKQTMQTAQKLYEKGLITYMRTDSPAVARSAQLAARDVISSIFGPHALPNKPPFYRAKGNAQEAHECIRPTDPKKLPKNARLTGNEAAVYRLIWMRFIASQMKPARYGITVVTIEPSQQGYPLPYHFEARGRILQDPGWLAVYKVGKGQVEENKKKEDDEEAQMLPALHPHEPLALKALAPHEHWTKPPSRYTEPSLIKQLEKEGVGRPSTYASILSTIQKRGYVVIKRKSLYPTDTGRAVTGFLVEQFPNLLDIGFTRQMEDNLDQVAEGKVAWSTLMGEFYNPLSERISQARAAAKDVPADQSLATPCPKCGTGMKMMYSKYGKYEQCPFCGHKPKDDKKAKETGQSCPECNKPLVQRNGRFGPFIACSGYPDCKYILKQEKSTRRRRTTKKSSTKRKGRSSKKSDLSAAGSPCPQCGNALVTRKGKYGDFVACSGFPGCRYIHKGEK